MSDDVQAPDDVMGPLGMSTTIGKIGAALAKAQASIGHALKDKNNPFFKSKYADLPSIVDASRPALTANEIAVLQPVSAEGSNVTVTTMLLHSSGEWISADLTVVSKDASPQGIGSAITYARRYGLAAMVGVAADDDDDGEAAQGRAFMKREDHAESGPSPAQASAAAKIREAMKSATTREALDAVVKKATELPEELRKPLRQLYADMLAKVTAPTLAVTGDLATRTIANLKTPPPPATDPFTAADQRPDDAAEDALVVEVRDLIKRLGAAKKPEMPKLVTRWLALPSDERESMLPLVQEAAKRLGHPMPDPADELRF